MLICTAVSLVAHGQGTFGNSTNIGAYLTGVAELPANGSTNVGIGVVGFFLPFTYTPTNNAQATIRVELPSTYTPNHAGIYGPASPLGTGPLILDLGQGTMVTNILVPFTNINVVFTNSATFMPIQMSNLFSGLWYINVTSTNYPAGELRGQLCLTPVLVHPNFASNRFSFNVVASPNQSYSIDVSTNLRSWSTLATLSSTNPTFQVIDLGATNRARFYRTRNP